MKFKKFAWMTFFSLLLIFSLIVGTIFSGLDDNAHKNRIRDFYIIPQNTIDVVYIGSSSVHTCIYPTLTWKKSGFTSYCFSMDKCSYISILPMLKEALRVQKPKLVVIDIDEFTLPDNYMDDEHPVMYWFESSKWNSTKIEAINKSIPAENKSYYYFPFINTHSIFSDFTKIKESFSLFKKYYIEKEKAKVYFKGSTISNIKRKDIVRLLNRDDFKETKPMNSVAEKYLDELLEYCKTCGTEILFIDYPKGRLKGDTELYNKVYTLPVIQKKIEDSGFKVLNYNLLDNPANITTSDFMIPESHLNVFGCEKFTEYISDYLSENYNLKSDYSEETIAGWNSDSEYVDSIIEKAKNDKNEVFLNENNIPGYMN